VSGRWLPEAEPHLASIVLVAVEAFADLIQRAIELMQHLRAGAVHSACL
jgi:hypothetical protein